MRALTIQRVKFTMGFPLLKMSISEPVNLKESNLVICPAGSSCWADVMKLSSTSVFEGSQIPPHKQLEELSISVKNTMNFVSSLVIREVLSMADMATGVKCGIIYWLFGGAIRNLGSPRHVTKWLQSLQEQKHTGMFGDRGHCSSRRGIQTEVTFDLAAQFVIDMPCENAKIYIRNVTCGNYTAVFMQLIINRKSQGPHCFIVPVKDENGNFYPGMTAIDMTYKEGLHGVGNGILKIGKVWIPMENLLNKFGSVTPDGYHSPIKDKSARFNVMLASLSPARLAVTFAGGAMKLGLMIAIRYSHR
ncbi:LOW QUALITY PROTEIN: acyl-coenzyme A oxidase-like protein [Ctenodactylus gundi]